MSYRINYRYQLDQYTDRWNHFLRNRTGRVISIIALVVVLPLLYQVLSGVLWFLLTILQYGLAALLAYVGYRLVRHVLSYEDIQL